MFYSLGGNVSATVLNDVKIESIQPVVNEKVEKGATFVTDDFGGYKTISEGYYHLSVNHKNGEYVRGIAHTNNIEGFWSQLKRTIKGTHIHVSPKHLQKYVDEVAFRYDHRKNQDTMFHTILSQVA